MARAAGDWKSNPHAREWQIAPELHDHPGVLEVRWHIYAKAKKWDRVLETASSQIKLVPDISLGWRHRSYCLHELKRTEETRDNPVRVVENFADDPILPYNLACYECQLGRLEQAKVWLEKACKMGGRKQIKLMALQDRDLEPLWEEMRQAKRPCNNNYGVARQTSDIMW